MRVRPAFPPAVVLASSLACGPATATPGDAPAASPPVAGVAAPIPPAEADPVRVALARIREGPYADHPVVPGSVRVMGGDPSSPLESVTLGGKEIRLDRRHLRGVGRSVVFGLLEDREADLPFFVYLDGARVLDVDVLSP